MCPTMFHLLPLYNANQWNNLCGSGDFVFPPPGRSCHPMMIFQTVGFPWSVEPQLTWTKCTTTDQLCDSFWTFAPIISCVRSVLTVTLYLPQGQAWTHVTRTPSFLLESKVHNVCCDSVISFIMCMQRTGCSAIISQLSPFSSVTVM